MATVTSPFLLRALLRLAYRVEPPPPRVPAANSKQNRAAHCRRNEDDRAKGQPGGFAGRRIRIRRRKLTDAADGTSRAGETQEANQHCAGRLPRLLAWSRYYKPLRTAPLPSCCRSLSASPPDAMNKERAYASLCLPSDHTPLVKTYGILISRSVFRSGKAFQLLENEKPGLPTEPSGSFLQREKGTRTRSVPHSRKQCRQPLTTPASPLLS